MANPPRKAPRPLLPNYAPSTTPAATPRPPFHITILPAIRRLPATILPSIRQRLSSNTLRLTSRLTLLFLSMYATAALTRSYLLDLSSNTGPSMLPTIPTKGSSSVWSPLYSGGRGIKIGDIVQARSPIHRGQMIGKRVVGMPGDYVLRDQHLASTVGGAGVLGEMGEREEPVMVQVPEGHVWLAGDNVSWSRDSRFYGPVPMALIKAKTLWHLNGWSTWEGVWMEQVKKVEDV